MHYTRYRLKESKKIKRGDITGKRKERGMQLKYSIMDSAVLGRHVYHTNG
jgi:hypothetical protein